MNKMITNKEFLPLELKKSKELNNTTKSVFATLIYLNGKFSKQVKENDGWFYCSTNELVKESKVSNKTVLKAVNLLNMKGYLERDFTENKGTAKYRLHLCNHDEITQVNYTSESAEDKDVNLCKNLCKMNEELHTRNRYRNRKRNISYNNLSNNINNNLSNQTNYTMEEMNNYTIEITNDNFKIVTDDIDNLTNDVLDKLIDKFNYIQSKLNNQTKHNPTIGFQTFAEIEVENDVEDLNDDLEDNDDSIEGKNDNNTNTVETNNTKSNNIGSRIIDRVIELKNELYNLKLDVSNESLCVGDNKYARKPIEIAEYVEQHKHEMTEKQYNYIQSLLDSYKRLLKNKLDKIHQFCYHREEPTVLKANQVDDTKKPMEDEDIAQLQDFLYAAVDDETVQTNNVREGVFVFLQNYALSDADKETIIEDCVKEFEDKRIEQYKTNQSPIAQSNNEVEEVKVEEEVVEPIEEMEEVTETETYSHFNFRNLGIDEVEKGNEEALNEIFKTRQN